MDFVKIADPDKPGDYLVLAKGAFDPTVHTRFDEPADARANPGTATPAVTAATEPPADQVTTANIAELTVAQAIPLIEAAGLDTLQTMQQQEAGRPSPRTGVLKALQARIDTLIAQG